MEVLIYTCLHWFRHRWFPCLAYSPANTPVHVLQYYMRRLTYVDLPRSPCWTNSPLHTPEPGTHYLRRLTYAGIPWFPSWRYSLSHTHKYPVPTMYHYLRRLTYTGILWLPCWAYNTALPRHRYTVVILWYPLCTTI